MNGKYWIEGDAGLSETRLAAIEKHLSMAANSGTAGVRFMLPRNADHWSREVGFACGFLGWLQERQARFFVYPDYDSFDYWMVDVYAETFAHCA